MGVVGSYGPEFIQWCSSSWSEAPLPWQAYVACRLLEHDADGRLIHRRAGISVPRQVGKSVLLRALAGWRMHQAQRFGEPQTVLHVAHMLTTTEEVFLPALEWARSRGYKVREANGQMRIENGGSRWLPRSTQTGYGFTLNLALIDEAWAVAERRVNSAYGPTLSARESGQVVMFSSANEEATPLFPRFRETARDGWLLLEWSAPPASDHTDPEVWQASTPIPISSTRAALMADELASDRETFRFERLNQWPSVDESLWLPVELVAACGRERVELGDPVAGAVEVDMSGRTWSAAVADRDGGIRVLPPCGFDTAMAWLKGHDLPVLLAHPSIVNRLPENVARAKPLTTRDAQAAVSVLDEMVRGGRVRWDHGDEVSAQFAAVVLAEADGGPRLLASKSRGDVSLVKVLAAVSWYASQRREPVMV